MFFVRLSRTVVSSTCNCIDFSLVTERPLTVRARIWGNNREAPAVVTTDNGTEFAGEFGHMLHRLGTYHVNTTPNHPPTNGVVESLVHVIKIMLKTHFNDHPCD